MEALEAEGGVCIFCPEHVAKQQREPVEHEGDALVCDKNDFPYEGAVAHYLIVAQRHVTSFEQLPDQAGAELWRSSESSTSGSARSHSRRWSAAGTCVYNGGSVAHLHVHLVVLDPAPPRPCAFG